MKIKEMAPQKRHSMNLRLSPEINTQMDELTRTVQGISKPFLKRSVSKTQVIEYTLLYALSNTKAFLAWVIDRIYRTKTEDK